MTRSLPNPARYPEMGEAGSPGYPLSGYSPRMYRSILVAAASAAVAGTAVAAPAVAAPDRIPPWPSVRAALPASFIRPATTDTDTYLARLRKRLDRRVGASALGHDVAVRVVDLSSAEPVYDHRGNVPMVPASTMKTATALAVLNARGADHRMITRAVLDPGHDTISIVGGGDPLLSSTEVEELARDTADALAGTDDENTKFDIAYDDSLFERPAQPRGWYDSYMGQYSADPTALTRYGSFSADSAQDTGKYFRRSLRHHDVRTSPGVTRDPSSAGGTELARSEGHTVAEALWPMLRNSDNTIAEIMIRHVAAARGLPTTSNGAADAVKAELGRLGVPTQRMTAADGSGLSRVDKVTAETLVSITRAAMDPDKPDLATGFRTASFPVAGRTGTLEDRFNDGGTRCAQGRVMAKTGTLSDVLALSGVASSTDGRLRAFAIVVNNKPSWASLTAARIQVDRIATAVAGCH